MVMFTLPLSQAKAKLTKLLTEVEELGERFVITRSGRPVGVLLSHEEYQGLLETLEILADNELPQAIEQGLKDIERDKLVSHEEIWDGVDSPLRG